MLGIRLCGAAILLPAECAAALRGRRVSGDFAIANTLTRYLQSAARPRHIGPGRNILAHICAVLLIQFRARIRNTLAVHRIVGPGGCSVNVADVRGVEIMLMNKRIVDDYCSVAPPGMPAPAAPSVPPTAEEEAHIDANSKTEAQASIDHAA